MDKHWGKGFLLGLWYATKGAVVAMIFLLVGSLVAHYFMPDDGTSIGDRLDQIEARLDALEEK